MRFTRSGVNGMSRSRAPIASKMALAIAAPTVQVAGSPAVLSVPLSVDGDQV
jgi:hypothetical protein